MLLGREWYLQGGTFDLARVTSGWRAKLAHALARGYAGIRVTGNTAWLEKKDWRDFCEYEEALNASVTHQRMTVLCSYPLAASGAAEILDVARTHQFAMAKRQGEWEVIETSELKQAKAEIQRLNAELEQRVVERTRQLTTVNEELRREISERQRAQEALQKAQAELAHTTRVMMLGELTASIAHEVNQPLASIITNGNACLRWLTRKTPDLEEARAAVARIIRDGHRASGVIDQIRALVKKTPPQNAWVDVNVLIQETVALVRGEMNGNQATLRTDLTPDLPAVLGDGVQLQQVLLNLLINGLEAMSGISDRVRELVIRSQRQDDPDGVFVAVRDCGIGLDPQILDRVFDAFVTTKPQGLGMGLSICRSIITAHGGRLWATPNMDHGATFQFTVPTNSESQ
jgi:C4-dicarboxylate-specific signal transduction histidine kinase